MEKFPSRQTRGQWVQTERAAHEAWAALIRKSPIAAQIMHLLTARVGQHNAVVISQKNLAELIKCNPRSVRNGLNVLKQDNWVEIRQIGGRGTVNAYVINDRIAWSGKRDGIRYSLFSAAVIASSDEQPDHEHLDDLPPLRQIPSMLRNEQQLPTGEGLPPPSEPSLPGMEPDLPATASDSDQIDLEDYLNTRTDTAR